MGQIYKLKPELISFLVTKKRRFPELSCRKLSQEASNKFGIKLSKSAVNTLLKNEELSSPIGRRPKQAIDFEKELERGAFFLLLAIDYLLEISEMVSEVMQRLFPIPTGVKKKDLQSVIKALLLSKSFYDVTLDISRCYNNIEVWAIIGYRPSKSIYNRISNMINNSQLFAGQLVKELRDYLKPVSAFRFVLSDESSFFVDAQFQSIWQGPPPKDIFYITNYKARRYTKEFSHNNQTFCVFNVSGSNIFTPEVLNFILSFDSDAVNKRLVRVELLDAENKVTETRFLPGQQTFFLLGFWPWQMETMYELERKPAEKRLFWEPFKMEYCYQIEEVLLPQPVTLERVKLRAILLKSSPLGAAKIGILTNLPEDIIHNYLSINELYHWIPPEERFGLFNQKLKNANVKKLHSSLFEELGRAEWEAEKSEKSEHSLDKIFEVLSRIIFQCFHQEFIPEECQKWNPFKIKDIFLRQKATIKREKEILVHNTFISNELCKEIYFKYISQKLNSLGIRDQESRLLWFRFETKHLQPSFVTDKD